MKRMNPFWTVCMVIVALSLATTEAAQWKKVFRHPDSKALNSIFVIDAQHGWAAGNDGTILAYNGKEWQPQTSGTGSHLNSLYFTAQNQGWAVGNNGTILKCNGSVWETQNSGTTRRLLNVFFIANDQGWAVGDSGVFLKYDGTAWKQQPSTITTNIYRIHLFAPQNGWLLNVEEANLTTKLFSSSGNDWSQNANYAMSLIPGMDFLSSTAGLVCGATINILTQSLSSIVLSYNGKEWQKTHASANVAFLAAEIVDPTHAWVTGSTMQGTTLLNGCIFRGNGQSWSEEKIDTLVPPIRTICFADTTNGWAAGDNGYILQYTNATPLLQENTRYDSRNLLLEPVSGGFIRFRTVMHGETIIELFSPAGRKLRTLFHSTIDAGWHQTSAGKLAGAGGTYILRFTNGTRTLYKKCELFR